MAERFRLVGPTQPPSEDLVDPSKQLKKPAPSRLKKSVLAAWNAGMIKAGTATENYGNRAAIKSTLHVIDDLNAAGISDEEIIQGPTPEALAAARLRNPSAMSLYDFDSHIVMDQFAKARFVTTILARAKGGSAALTMLGKGFTPEQAARYWPVHRPASPKPSYPRGYIAPGSKFATPYEKEMTTRALGLVGQTYGDLHDAGFTDEEVDKVVSGKDVGVRSKKQGDAIDAANKAGEVAMNLLEKGFSVSGLTAAQHGGSAALGRLGMTPEQAARIAAFTHKRASEGDTYIRNRHDHL